MQFGARNKAIEKQQLEQNFSTNAFVSEHKLSGFDTVDQLALNSSNFRFSRQVGWYAYRYLAEHRSAPHTDC
jgi:hypothetical protein